MDITKLGARLKMFRVCHKMTQYELAAPLHLSRQAVSNYEAGIRMPDIFMIWMIADVFEMSVDELIGRDF